MHRDAARLELRSGACAALVASERREEVDRVGEHRELDGRNRASSRRLLPRLLRVDDLPLAGNRLDRHEFEVLDMAHDGGTHGRHAHKSAADGVSPG